jgi:hypothetical protein
MPLIRRHLPALCVLLAVIALVVPQFLRRADAAAPPVAVALAGPDYASDTFGDPWDMSDSADMSLDPLGPTLYVTNQHYSGGLVSLATSQVSYVSLLWSGVPGSLTWGREGRVPGNRIPAATYPRFHAHLYASVPIGVRIAWTGVCSSGCDGYDPINLAAGWNDVNVDLASNAVGTPWSGSLQSLQLVFMTNHATTLGIDFVRLYHPISAGVVSWAAPGAKSATLHWSSTGVFSAGDSATSGTVPGTSSANSSSPARVDLSGWAPGTTLFAYDGTTATEVAQVAPEPLPVIDSPTARGCNGITWHFPGPGSTAGIFNANQITYSSAGELSATNAPPQQNDPHVLMPVGAGFDGRAYHRLTVVESYDGSFNLADTAGGGTMGRVLWRVPGTVTLSQTPPLVTPTGQQVIVVDMAQPTSVITDPAGTPAMRYAFTAPINELRWDPNEDRGTRRWHLFAMRVGKDCATKTAFSITWHDEAYVPGSVVTIWGRTPGGHTQTFASNLAEHSGSNAFTIYSVNIQAQVYTIFVQVTTPSGATHTTHDGPLRIGFGYA